MIYWLQEAAIVGAIVGLVGVLISQYLTQRRHSQTLEQTAELEAQRAHEAALQKYFEQMRYSLADPERPLRRSTMGDNLSTVARAQTLAVLEGLDPQRKRILLQFLYESNLIKVHKPIIRLRGANLRRADLSMAHLEGADLSGADLREANLKGAVLFRANLRAAVLVEANLRVAYLIEADLSEANLIGARLFRAVLYKAVLFGTYLSIPDLTIGAHLSEADLSGADLREAKRLTQQQINQANGDETTQLPDHLQRPAHWSKGETKES